MNVAECKNDKKYFHKSIGIGIGILFTKVLLLILTIVSQVLVNIPGSGWGLS